MENLIYASHFSGNGEGNKTTKAPSFQDWRCDERDRQTRECHVSLSVKSSVEKK
jgi:hypothetical protein